jgi:tRNA(fMet)-specific endonuclease VapC
MKYLLDTNVCVQILRKKGSPLVKQRLGAHPPIDVVLCSIVVAELFYGAERSAKPTTGRQQTDAFIAHFKSLSVDEAVARVYGRIRSDLERLGRPIGQNDYLIAALAVANNLVLVTHNTIEFSRVPGLVLEDWETP